MNDDRLKTIWEGFTHAPLGLGEMEALRFVRDEAVKSGIGDQSEVDWSVVREAVVDTCDERGIGGDRALQSSCKTCGLLVAHEVDNTALLAGWPIIAVASAPKASAIDPGCCLGLTIEECSHVPTSQCDGHGSAPPSPGARVTDEMVEVAIAASQAASNELDPHIHNLAEWQARAARETMRAALTSTLSLSKPQRLTEGEMRALYRETIARLFPPGLQISASLTSAEDIALAFGNAIQDRTR